MDNEIKVSVFCTAYNHEKYIRKCLDGFVMQKTNFAFEVIVNDDASTDHTAEIIREYEEKYPEIIKPIYQTENQYSKGVGITNNIIRPKAKGKYYAWCEGDDFWVDPYKLQKQYEVLENNPDCRMCVCRVHGVDEAGNPTKLFFPNEDISTPIIESRPFIKMVTEGYPFQTSGYFVVGEDYDSYSTENPEFSKNVPVGDIPKLLYFGQLGKVYYLKDVMSCYRMNSLSSLARRANESSKSVISSKHRMIDMVENYDAYTAGKYHDILENYHKRLLIRSYCIKGQYKELIKCKFELSQLLTKKQVVDIYLRAYLPHIYPEMYNAYRRLQNKPAVNEGR